MAPAGAEPTWTGWYARAVVRAQGLRHGAARPATASPQARAAVTGLLDDQCGYHEATAERMHRLEHRLERAGLACFALTIAAALAYLAVKLPDLAARRAGTRPRREPGDSFGIVVAALTAGLPALATATYGIRVIGDFAGISRRSQRTHDGVLAALVAADRRRGRRTCSSLRARVRAAADVMLGDVAGWRLSAESRGLAIPG